MKQCNFGEDCIPVCNHCIHMKGWEWDRGLRSYKRSANSMGYCDFHKKAADPGSACDDFHCFRTILDDPGRCVDPNVEPAK